MKALLVLFLAAALCACTPSIVMKNAKTGQVAVCKGGCAEGGLAGIPCRNLQRQCVDDFQKAGYERQP
jgi:hypothetical protein